MDNPFLLEHAITTENPFLFQSLVRKRESDDEGDREKKVRRKENEPSWWIQMTEPTNPFD